MRRTLTLSDEAWEDYLYWQGTERAMPRRVNQPSKDIRRSSYEGGGKPEPLKH